jgi:hypothetical protein
MSITVPSPLSSGDYTSGLDISKETTFRSTILPVIADFAKKNIRTLNSFRVTVGYC